MHILFLTHYFPPEVNAPASRTFEHVREWVKTPGVKVTVITNHPNQPNGILYPGARNTWRSRESMAGIDVIRVKTFLSPNKGFFGRTISFLWFMVMAVAAGIAVRKPTLVIATSPQFFCAVAGYLVSFLKRIPFVFELRDLWPDSIVTVGAMKPSPIIRLLERIELFLYRRAALIVPVTDSFKTNLIERGIDAEKITVIKNGVDLSFFSPQESDAELRASLDACNKFVVSYIGTIGMAHAVETIVSAAEALRDDTSILVLIVGEGADKDRISQLVQSKRLPNLRLLPGVTKERVRELYALTDLNLVTLRNKELFSGVIPSKIFEILSMARPILLSVDGEARMILESAQAGLFVPPENSAELASKIRLLASDLPLAKKMGENGRGFVLENFDRRLLADRMLRALFMIPGLPAPTRELRENDNPDLAPHR